MLCLNLNAQTVSVETAKQRAVSFLQSKLTSASDSRSHLRQAGASRLKLAHTAQTDNEPQYYVFNVTGGGFIVSGAQEVAEDVLAYSEAGEFSYENANPNLKYWLDEYQRQINAAMNDGMRPYITATSPKTYHPQDVEILIKTRWNQEAPYWNMCPKVKSRSCYTGCVATAMSQVMKYHEWPKAGMGSHTYTDLPVADGGCGQTLTANFEEHTYDWDNMRNTYGSTSSSYSKAEGDAVALLMSDAGISVNMEYTNEGSGAFTENCTYAFVTYFGYDAGIMHSYRDCYDDNEWDEIIYNELINGRPVMYGGSTSDDEGHSFICDGYKVSTDQYHFNWGWSGDGDCYCKLSAVKGYGSRWDYYQDIVYGIKPAEEGSTAQTQIVAYDMGDFEFTATEKGGYTTYNVTFGSDWYQGEIYYNCIMNDSWQDAEVVFNIMYVNTETGTEYYATPHDIEANRYSFKHLYPFEEFDDFCESVKVRDLTMPKMPAGNYQVFLVYKDYENAGTDDDSLWKVVRAFDSTNYGTMAVESNIEAPVATAATGISKDAFTANWEEIDNATSYTLELTQTEKGAAPQRTLISEDFSKLASQSADGTLAITDFDQYMTDEGWTGQNVFTSTSRLKLSSSKKVGTLTSPMMDNPQSDVTVQFKEATYGNDVATLTVLLLSADGTEMGSQTFNVDGIEHTATFTGVDEPFKVAFTTSVAKRCYISSIEITSGGTAKSTTTLFPDITDTQYTLTDLNLEEYDYSYRVMGVTDEGESKWSNSIDVELNNAVAISQTTNAATSGNSIYNIYGQRTNRLQRGINIVGGKKVLVK